MKRVFLFVFLASLFIRCENDSVGDCSIPATIRDLTGLDGCGFVFELENGTRLEPERPVIFCGTPPLPKEVTEDPLFNFEFVDGKKVLISYEETNRPSICMVGPTAKITCIKEVASFPEE